MNYTIASILISIASSMPMPASATVDECKVAIVDFNKKNNPNFDISVVKEKDGSVSMVARSSKQAGTRAQAEFNGVARTCMIAGFNHGIFMGTVGSNVSNSICLIVDYNSGGADCNKTDKPRTLEITRVESKMK